MAPRPVALVAPVLAICAAALLVVSGPASAIYIVTPLTLSVSPAEGEVGDEITLTLGPNPDDENATTYAGREVRIRYAWNANEGQEPDGATSDSEADEVIGDAGLVTLDDNTRGSLTWTIPPEADDHNVFFTVLSEDDEPLAHGHVRVGDAEPVMMLMGGDDAIAESGPGETPLAQGDDTAADESGNAVPAAGMALVLGALGLVALAIVRRR